MPPKAASAEGAISDNNLTFLFSVFRTCEDIKPDWNRVATENGIAYARNANTRFQTTLKKMGYKLLEGRIMKIDEEGAPTPPVTPKKAEKKTPAKASGKTPAKKRKAAEMEKSSDEGEEQAVKSEENAVKSEEDADDSSGGSGGDSEKSS